MIPVLNQNQRGGLYLLKIITRILNTHVHLTRKPILGWELNQHYLPSGLSSTSPNLQLPNRSVKGKIGTARK